MRAAHAHRNERCVQIQIQSTSAHALLIYKCTENEPDGVSRVGKRRVNYKVIRGRPVAVAHHNPHVRQTCAVQTAPQQLHVARVVLLLVPDLSSDKAFANMPCQCSGLECSHSLEYTRDYNVRRCSRCRARARVWRRGSNARCSRRCVRGEHRDWRVCRALWRRRASRGRPKRVQRELLQDYAIKYVSLMIVWNVL